jgi:hypothetical protein
MGGGGREVRRVSQLGIGILLFAATSILAAEQPLEPGYFKWLLHLGQSPSDRVLHDVLHHDQLEFFGAESSITPAPGEIYDFSDSLYAATTNLMIWTAQHNPDGFFSSQPLEGYFIQYYHIYIFSPEQREARLRFRVYGSLRVWSNGEMLVSQGSDGTVEQPVDFLLHEGVNSMSFKLGGRGSPERANYLALRITDRNDNEYSDLRYSLSPPLPEADVRVSRHLPSQYGSLNELPIRLSLEVSPEATADKLTIIEYIPEGLSVTDAGGGNIVGNSIQWFSTADDLPTTQVQYSLSAPTDYTGTIAFSGYVHYEKKLEAIVGDTLIFKQAPSSASDRAESIETIEINAGDYSRADGVTVGGEFANDYSGSLESYYRGLVSGLKPHQTGGWAEYEFFVENPSRYHIVLDYGELWTMFHHNASVVVTIDDNVQFQASLFPTTHSYGFYTQCEVEYPWNDPERKAKWIVGSVDLDAGQHTLRLTFPQMYAADMSLDRFNDGRPVITKIFIINYPGLAVPGLAEPHQLDSYEHAPARIVHNRDIAVLPDGRVEMGFHGTFYSLSQGNEIYFADGYVQPRPNENTAKFEIVSMEPSVFHLPPGGEQDFVLIVRSSESVPDDYSELVVVWLQGAPSGPARKPYLFTTAVNYIELPPQPHGLMASAFSLAAWESRKISVDVTDPAEMFIPDRNDLGFDKGRYSRDLPQFFTDQFVRGYLPSVEAIFRNRGWDYNHHSDTHGVVSWGRIWSEVMCSLYWRDIPAQAEAYVKRLSENMVFYPVTIRWDWARPQYMPPFAWVDFVNGVPALLAHVRVAQEGMIDDTEQFQILHNLVLPIFNSYWDELRTTAIVAEDVNAGDTKLPISRPFYGDTGSPTNGFYTFPLAYIKVGGDLYHIKWASTATKLLLQEPLRKAYPKGTLISSWAFSEEIELEGRDIISPIALAAASRDPAVIDEAIAILGEIYSRQKIFLEDGSFRNEPGSYGNVSYLYPEALLNVERLLGREALGGISEDAWRKIHEYLVHASDFVFSNGLHPQLNGGGALNQLGPYCGLAGLVDMLEALFPEDRENIDLYRRISGQMQNRVPGDIIDNRNFVVNGWGYAMLRSEGSWDRRMETLLSSKHLLSDPGDHVSRDCLGTVIYGLGAILTPRYGYNWVGYLPPFLNQVMVDDDREGNRYYGAFWHFDGRKELPSAVAHTGDGDDCSTLDYDMSRWCIQFPEYLFDTYFVQAKDPNVHQYDWSLINMGEMEIVEPQPLVWQPCPQFLDGYWPDPGTRGGGPRTIAGKGPGRVVVDWHISNGPWVPRGDETLLRFTPAHSGRLRLIMADDGPADLIDAQIGYYDQPDFFQANSQDILVIRKSASSHAFVGTLEPIADDEQAYVKDVVVVERGSHNQQLVKVVTAEGEDWVYLSGKWGARPNGDQPVAGVTTDADIVVWRVVNSAVKGVYLAGGSYANTAHGSWNFGSYGNHYVPDMAGATGY